MEKNNEFKKKQLNKDDYKTQKKIVKGIKFVGAALVTIGSVVASAFAIKGKSDNNSQK